MTTTTAERPAAKDAAAAEAPSGDTRQGRLEEDLAADLDVEMALLALSAQDVGGPTEAVDLGALSATEKRVLLEMLRKRLYGRDAPTCESAHPADQPRPAAEAPADTGSVR